MSIPAPRHRYTFAEYLELEEIARVRHEYYQGEIYAMAGGTPEHAAMAATITSILGRQLASPCRVYSSDLRVRVVATGLATYPDVTVICGPSERDPESATHVTNPTLIVEVLSDSTADYDRTEKLQHYQAIASLQGVLLVDHRSQRVDFWQREDAGWRARRFGPGEAVPITAIQCSLPVDEIYAAALEA
jgi:Uma2 family endonuclease